MGIFDCIELKQHIQAIGEYVFYIADVYSNQVSEFPQEVASSLNYIRDHLKNMSDVLKKYD